MGRYRARDAEPLLLTARQVSAGIAQSIFDLVPKADRAKRLFDQGIALFPARHDSLN